jgi:hypothetical protein
MQVLMLAERHTRSIRAGSFGIDPKLYLEVQVDVSIKLPCTAFLFTGAGAFCRLFGWNVVQRAACRIAFTSRAFLDFLVPYQGEITLYF